MAIENVAGMNKMLSSYSTGDWMKSASIDQATSAEFSGLNPNAATGVKAPESFSEMLTKSLADVKISEWKK